MKREELAVLSHKVALRMEDLLDLFGVEYLRQYDRITCACPIHEGADNPQAFTITMEDKYFGCWRCWTHGCEEKFLHTPIGLIRGLLSSRKGKEVPFQEAVNFSLEFVSSSVEDLAKESHDFKVEKVTIPSDPLKNRHIPDRAMTRKTVRNSLSRPVKYYLNRGYSEDTLDKFDVGICSDSSKQMNGRIVVPVYDDNHEYMVGCVGRAQTETSNGFKWVNSKNFNSGLYLYGYWLAKDKIRETKTVILVEGQGDVWRLYEAGIGNAVGMLGASLSDGQARILETSGAFNVVVLTDNDDAGVKAKKSVGKKCERLFHLVFPEFSKEDIGEMSVNEIETIIKPQLTGMI